MPNASSGCAHESYAELYDAEQRSSRALGTSGSGSGSWPRSIARFVPYLERATAIKAQLEDLAFTLRDFADGIDASPARLQEVEDRLALLERLKRKHGPHTGRRDCPARRAGRGACGAGRRQSSLAELEQELADGPAAYLRLARRALRQRAKARRPRWPAASKRELADLAMEQSHDSKSGCATADSEGQWTERGLDQVEFFLSANLGEEPRPLARIVSGGELSRVMLALKTLSAATVQTRAPAKTLIFDEVDAGIGGRVATVVGQKLASLGERYQVLCITHLPQIAACGRTHFLIQKRVARPAHRDQRLETG